MAKPGYTGFKRIAWATKYSLDGFIAAWKNESAFRQESILATAMVPAAFYVGESTLQILLLIGVVALVLIVELLNSAIEAIVDRIGSEYHELSGRAKDMGSAAVFVSLTLVTIVWATVLASNFLEFS